MVKRIHTAADAVLADLTAGMKHCLGDQLIGVYLYGSLVWGDFDEEISDLDTAAFLKQPLSESQLESLRQMHAKLIEKHPKWNDRIEAQYVDVEGLKSFRTVPFTMGNISPGEPLHLIPSNQDWLMNWYFVQEYGETLFGEAPQVWIPPITIAEFRASILDQLVQWRTHIDHTADSRPYQGYAILTMCRSLYTLKTGQQTSKREAMEWVCERYPSYASMAKQAWQWRTDYQEAVDPDKTFAQVKQFVLGMIDDMLDTFQQDKK